MNKTEQMKQVLLDVVNLKSSPLYEYRVKNKYYPVIGEGSHDAKIMFIGEAPGRNEAETGHPFCGRSGKMLDELLKSIDLDRKEVYITNIVKDRPQDNRDPSPEEIEIYSPFLDRQIEIIKPKIIATLGRFSMQYIIERYGPMDKLAPIGSLHGKVLSTEIGGEEVKIIPLYHPAVAIYNQNTKGDLIKDFKILKKYL